ncbi:MAG: IPT/TIG domain-containing protein, partial [Methylosarcina sp.]
IPTGKGPYWVQLNHDASKLYVTNPLGGTTSIIDTASLTVTSTITTNLNPWTVLEGPVTTSDTTGAPTISSITPRFVKRNQTVTFTITGTNFSSAPTVTISPSTGITVQSVSCTSTSCTVKANLSSSTPTGSKGVTVKNSDGQSVSVTNGFMVKL